MISRGTFEWHRERECACALHSLILCSAMHRLAPVGPRMLRLLIQIVLSVPSQYASDRLRILAALTLGYHG